MTMGEIGCFLSHYVIWQDVSLQRVIFSSQLVILVIFTAFTSSVGVRLH